MFVFKRKSTGLEVMLTNTRVSVYLLLQEDIIVHLSFETEERT